MLGRSEIFRAAAIVALVAVVLAWSVAMSYVGRLRREPTVDLSTAKQIILHAATTCSRQPPFDQEQQ